MDLQYLKSFSKNCDLKALQKIKEDKMRALESNPNYSQYQKIINNLPEIQAKYIDLAYNSVIIGKDNEIDEQTSRQIEKSAKELIPWKKGPFSLFDIKIDAEWRSDLKWNRLSKHINDLKDKVVLDIGCNNGYFMYKMALNHPKLVMGIDPIIRPYFQFKFLQNFSHLPNLQFELFGVEHLKLFDNMFDTIFSMGIIYHHRNPILQLQEIYKALKPGGQLILESIGIPGDQSMALFPSDRYAKMKNVWFIPTESCLYNWAQKAKFIDIEIISTSKMTANEQRNTEWCPAPHQSLPDFLDNNDPNYTLEGYQAPIRICLKAHKKNI